MRTVARRATGPGGLVVLMVVGLIAVFGATPRGGPATGGHHAGHEGHTMPMVLVPASAYTSLAPLLDRRGWRAWSARSRTHQQSGQAAAGRAMNVLDGSRETFWHSPLADTAGRSPVRLRRITVDTRTVQPISALRYTPGPRRVGRIGAYDVAVSDDRRTWVPVTMGRSANSPRVKVASFRLVRSVRPTHRSRPRGWRAHDQRGRDRAVRRAREERPHPDGDLDTDRRSEPWVRGHRRSHADQRADAAPHRDEPPDALAHRHRHTHRERHPDRERYADRHRHAHRERHPDRERYAD